MMASLLLKLVWVLFAVMPQNSGVIEGTVTRFGTTDGLAGVSITITRDGQEELQGEPDAMTDASGHFIIRNAAPGLYTIRASRPGYVAPSKDGVPIENANAKEIRVDLAQPLKNIDFALNPGGVLAGRVYDLLGRPAENAIVEAIPVEGVSSANRQMRATSSDDSVADTDCARTVAPSGSRMRTVMACGPRRVESMWMLARSLPSGADRVTGGP